MSIDVNKNALASVANTLKHGSPENNLPAPPSLLPLESSTPVEQWDVSGIKTQEEMLADIIKSLKTDPAYAARFYGAIASGAKRTNADPSALHLVLEPLRKLTAQTPVEQWDVSSVLSKEEQEKVLTEFMKGQGALVALAASHAAFHNGAALDAASLQNLFTLPTFVPDKPHADMSALFKQAPFTGDIKHWDLTNIKPVDPKTFEAAKAVEMELPPTPFDVDMTQWQINVSDEAMAKALKQLKAANPSDNTPSGP